MSVEAWTRTPEYTVGGIGPYTITHPYTVGAIRVSVMTPTGLLALNPSEFSITPEASKTEGQVFLTPTTAATHAARSLIIDRITPDEQGWLAVQGEREAGLAAQLDRMVQVNQELRAEGGGALRIREPLAPFDWADNTVPLRSGSRVISGPTAAEITGAAAAAATATTKAMEAAASAAEALAKQNSMLRPRGTWTTATAYTPSDIARQGTIQYRCLVAHTSGVFATDLEAGRWEVWLQDGAAGPGSGDMLKSENLSGLTNYALARNNMGLQALAQKAQVAFADIDPAAVITDVETLAANKVANAIPVAKAVTDYIDSRLIPPAPLAAWTWSTNVSSIPLINLAGWDSVLVTGEITISGNPKLEVSADNGVSWRTSNYSGRIWDEGSAEEFSTHYPLSRIGAGTLSFDVTAQRMAQVRSTHFSGSGRHSNPRLPFHAGTHNAAEVINALRLTGVTFSGGYVQVFGLRRAAP